MVKKKSPAIDFVDKAKTFPVLNGLCPLETIELTIDTNYVPTWGLWEGVRDFVQNAKDQEDRSRIPMKLDYHKTSKLFGDNTLILRNTHTSLSRDVLLLGYTTKEGDSTQRGKFGEGLKLACLALIRSGCAVMICTNQEWLVPRMLPSQKFPGRETLHILIYSKKQGDSSLKAVEVFIRGLEESAWQEIKTRFLFIHPPKTTVTVKKGWILTEKRYKGQCFVKGIYVSSTSFHFGYDFSEIELDRDRNMIEPHELATVVASMLQEAVVIGPEKIKKTIYQLLIEDKNEVQKLPYIWSNRSAARIELVRIFKKKHGAKAIPVGSIEQSKTAERLGMKGIVMADRAAQFLIQEFEAESKALENKVIIKKCFAYEKLLEKEQKVLLKAAALVTAAYSKFNLDRVQIVEFESLTSAIYLGMHEPDGTIL